MADIRGLAKLVGLDFTTRTYKDARMTGDGSLITAPWFNTLVFNGNVFGMHAGEITTGIAGHAAVDADQPEAAVRVPDGTEIMPLFLQANLQSGETTLGIHGLMFAASNIDVGNGTSTAYQTTGVPTNLRMDNPIGSSCIARHTYSGNGTDPLTAGNFMELGRVGGTIDSDVVDTGTTIMVPLVLSAMLRPMPVIKDAGSLLGYGEGGTGANFFFQLVWMENSEGWLSS